MNDNNKIKIDLSLIPEHVKESLAAATLKFIQDIKKNYPKEHKILVNSILSEKDK